MQKKYSQAKRNWWFRRLVEEKRTGADSINYNAKFAFDRFIHSALTVTFHFLVIIMCKQKEYANTWQEHTFLLTQYI